MIFNACTEKPVPIKEIYFSMALENKIIEKGQLVPDYDEIYVAEYMKGEKIDITVDLNLGKKNFTAYTMDLTKKYIEINADYRT